MSWWMGINAGRRWGRLGSHIQNHTSIPADRINGKHRGVIKSSCASWTYQRLSVPTEQPPHFVKIIRENAISFVTCWGRLSCLSGLQTNCLCSSSENHCWVFQSEKKMFAIFYVEKLSKKLLHHVVWFHSWRFKITQDNYFCNSKCVFYVWFFSKPPKNAFFFQKQRCFHSNDLWRKPQIFDTFSVSSLDFTDQSWSN